MCRHLAYLGAPLSLDALLLRGGHSLERQSWAPREMEGALLNADGFGVGFFAPHRDEPSRYRSVLPLWGDETFAELAPGVLARAAIANARSATPGLGGGLVNTPPYVGAGWVFSHNGLIEGFREVERAVRDALSDDAWKLVRGTTDSECLFALFADACRESAPAEALVRSFATLARLAPERRALLSVVATDGTQVLAVTHALHGNPPSLYRACRDDVVRVASEPLDDDAWEPLKPGVVHVLRPGRVEEVAT
ncbi:MAG: ergothioneine biosynthesis protein EgtC [Sandaracinus sp.]|nr:ergothioneine biosynthesis protein EgtC [Myxococcales bacterium]MCB9599256.1 ergothioneine biosynthesis protein EgtC [Sandaracinus sp.]